MSQKNQRVRIISDQAPRAYAPDFVGWGNFDHSLPSGVQGLVDVPVGSEGTVDYVEQHGMNPYTRYTIVVDGVGRVCGVHPEHIKFV